MLNLGHRILKTEKFVQYPAEKERPITAFYAESGLPIASDLVSKMFDGDEWTKFEGPRVQAGIPGGVRFEFGQAVVFKRLVMRHRYDQTIPPVCLLLDGAPPPGDATGCNPIRNQYRSLHTLGQTVDLFWEDYQMQTAGQRISSFTLQFAETNSEPIIPELLIYFQESTYTMSNFIPQNSWKMVAAGGNAVCGHLMNGVQINKNPGSVPVKGVGAQCASWDSKVTPAPKEVVLSTTLSAPAGDNIICPWPYVATELCTISDHRRVSCAGKHHSLTCKKFKDVELDGHTDVIELNLSPNEKAVCPLNYAVVGLCSSDGLIKCGDAWGSVTCAPIKFKECANADELLASNVEIEYRLTPAIKHVYKNNGKVIYEPENYQEGVCALGHVFDRLGLDEAKAKQVLVRGVGDAVKAPKEKKRLGGFGSGSIYELIPEEGYVCLGDIFIKSYSTIDLSKFCCVRKDLTVLAAEHFFYEDINLIFPVRDHHDTQGLNAGLFYWNNNDYMELRETRLLRVDNVKVKLTMDMRGPTDRPIQIQEANPSLVWSLPMDSAAQDRHGKFDSFSVWRADLLDQGSHRLGDILSKEKPNFHFLFKSKDRRTFMPPSTYFERWTAENSFLKNEGVTVWEPSCPDNYRALGNLITINDENDEPVEPKKSDFSCVLADHVTESKREGQISKTFTHIESKNRRNSLGDWFWFDYKQRMFIKKSSLQYIAEKPVASSRMVEVKYDMDSKEVNPDNIKGLRKASVINRSYFPQCATRSYEFSVAESVSFSFGVEFDTGVSFAGEAPNVQRSITFSASFERSVESSSEVTSSADATLEMPEESQLSVTILRREYEQKIPFRAVIEKLYVDGSVGYQVVDGVFKGVSTSEIVIDYGEIEFLNAASRYEDSPGLIYKKGDHEKSWFNLGSDDLYTPPDRKQPVGIWGPSKTVEEGYCSMGDVAVQGYDYPEIEHFVAHAIAPGALVRPVGFFEEFDDTGSGVDKPVTFYDMLAPCGYTCLGSVAVTSRTERPDLNKYCCVNNEYLTKGNNEFVWSNQGNKALREASIWWNVKKDESGIYQGHFMAVTGHGSPYAWLAYILSGRVTENK